MMETKGHSEEYFGDFRDYWYNQDFLELMAKRWELWKVRSLLDVGCGQCYWTRVVSQFLPEGAEVTAVDADAKWAKEDSRIKDFFINKELDFEIRQADVLKLPFADNSFDAVTCQTVLIHMENPQNALREMKRVLKPGGLLFCAEPNNLTNSVIKDSLTAKFETDEIIEWFTYGLIIEKGKIELGKGDNSVGDLLPKYFSELELEDINVYLSDKANLVIPPYESNEIKALLEYWFENDFTDEMKAEIKKHFDTFGGKYEEIRQRVEAKAEKYKKEIKEAIEKDDFYKVIPPVMYLISGRK